MGLTAAVAGASGYAGGELLRLLLQHPSLQVGPVCAGAAAGAGVGALHPHLVPLADRRFEPTEAATLATADVVFLALPHGESATLVEQLPADLPVVDLGADFRLGSAAEWERWYGGDHAGHWTYGLPELRGGRAAVAASTRVANPGCYATAVLLALAPLLAAGAVETDDLVVVASSGTTGAGRAANAAMLGSEVMGDLRAYKVAAHQHTPEIVQALTAAAGAPVSLSLTTVLAPMPRGILATCTARVPRGATADALARLLQEAYADEAFVHVLPEGHWPRTSATTGSNSCHLQVAVDADAGRAVVVSAIDNLGKGAAGQAVQNANLVLGLPEGAGLSPVGGAR